MRVMGEQRYKSILLIGVSCLTLSGIAFPSSARAQSPTSEKGSSTSSDPAGYQVEDIVVTASKRVQSINDVGLTITAVSGESLISRGVTSTADLVKVTSGLTYTPTHYNTPVYTLRGVGYYDNSLSGSPAVSVYVDEVPLAYPAMTQGATLDLERVEVLKGPQGTLFGQNSTGGAINFIAAKPADTFKAGGSIGFARFATVDTGGFITGPLSSTLRARLALRTIQSGNWQKSYTRDDSLGATNQFMGRLLLDWTPTDRLSVNTNLNFWYDGSNTLAFQLQQVHPTRIANAPVSFINYPLAPRNARAADWSRGFPMKADNLFYEASVRVDVDITDTVKLTSISAYQHFDQDQYNDVDATTFRQNDFRSLGTINSFNQELRLSGDTGPLTWILGANYARAKIVDTFIGDATDGTASQPVPTVPGFRFVLPTARSKPRTIALFANGEYEIVPGLTIVGGIRYTDVKTKFRGCNEVIDINFGRAFEVIQRSIKGSFIPIGLGDCAEFDAQANPGAFISSLPENNLSWRAGVNYRTPGGTLAYASISKGYKSGSFPLIVATVQSAYKPAVQEEVLAYEAGLKLPLFDNRARITSAVFYYGYVNKQTRGRYVDNLLGLQARLENIPKSRVKGAEVELQASPARGLELSLAAAYLDTKVNRYTGYNLQNLLQSFAGSPFPNTPKFTAVGDAQYSFSLGDRRELFLGTGFRHHGVASSTFYVGSIPPIFRLRPYTLIDLRAGMQADNGEWRLTIWGRNITNEYYWNQAFRSGETTFRQAGKPATYGVTLAVMVGQ